MVGSTVVNTPGMATDDSPTKNQYRERPFAIVMSATSPGNASAFQDHENVELEKLLLELQQQDVEELESDTLALSLQFSSVPFRDDQDTVYFDDVVGHDSCKAQCEPLLGALVGSNDEDGTEEEEYPESIAILLSGPKGCGKARKSNAGEYLF